MRKKRNSKSKLISFEPDSHETQVEGIYGRLPEVHVDQSFGAIFPVPISQPHRFSWFQAGMLAQQLLLELSSFQTALERWLTQNDPTKIKEFDQLASHWNEINRNYVALSQMTRYLESWVPQLEAHWNNGNEEDQSAEKLVHALFKKEPIPPSVYETLREDLRPQRVMNRSFLPDDLEDAEGGLINLPIATDITNPSFRAEVEGALITHWNQSSWAKANNISFYISWTFLAPNTAFATGKENLNQHLAHFPPIRP